MNEELSSNGLTRRSFIKRSVVASVAVAGMTIFSGLVHAGSVQNPYCSSTANRATHDGVQDKDYSCKIQPPADGSSCSEEVVCGKDANGNDVKVKCDSVVVKCRTLATDFP